MTSAEAPFTAIWTPPKPERWPQKPVGVIGASSTRRNSSARQETSRRHPQGTPTGVWRQPSCHLGAARTIGLHSKKHSQPIASATRSSGGSSAANWKSSTAKLSSIAVHLNIGTSKFIARQYAKPLMAHFSHGARQTVSMLIETAIFQGSCNTEVVDVKCCCPCCRRAA